jgi:ATP-binding cassette subfamily C protein CydC
MKPAVHDDLALVARLFLVSGARRLLVGALLATVTVLAGMALLGTSGWFITATGLAGLSTAGLLAFNVFVPSAAIRLLALGRTFGRYFERVVTHDATLAALATLRERLFRGWAEPMAARALLRRPARLLFRLTNDVDALETVYLRLLVPAVAACGAALLAGGLLGLLDWRLGLAMFIWLLACGWGVALFAARRAAPLALRRAHALERLREGTADLVAGQTDLAMAGRLGEQCARLAAIDARLARSDERLHRLETNAGWIYAAAGHLTVATVLLAAGWLAGQGTVGAPLAALAVLTALAALEPFSALRRGAIEAGRSRLAARRLAPRLRPAEPGKPCSRAGKAALYLHQASVRHTGRGRAALLDASLCIEQGERVAVIGLSGAGKSTLLALAAGEVAPTAGWVESTPCTWLTQKTELFQDSLRDNLRLADPDAGDERLWDALDAAGLGREVRAFTQGLDTPLGEGGLGLSGGQARRLALARLLLREARFWLLDEPTEGLDDDTAADVLARLARHAAGRTVLVATHLRREAALADRLLVMDEGRIVAELHRGGIDFDAALGALRDHHTPVFINK